MYRVAGNFRGRNFCELVKKLLWIGHFCHAKGRHAPEFGRGNFVNSHKTVKKFSPSKDSRYMIHCALKVSPERMMGSISS